MKFHRTRENKIVAIKMKILRIKIKKKNERRLEYFSLKNFHFPQHNFGEDVLLATSTVRNSIEEPKL